MQLHKSRLAVQRAALYCWRDLIDEALGAADRGRRGRGLAPDCILHFTLALALENIIIPHPFSLSLGRSLRKITFLFSFSSLNGCAR